MGRAEPGLRGRGRAAAGPRCRRGVRIRALSTAVLALVALAPGCGHPGGPSAGPVPEVEGAGPIFAVAARGSPERISPAELVARLAARRAVLLGERHDHPVHHRLQAWVLERLAARGGHGAVVFEMLSLERTAELAALTARGPVDPDRFRRVVGWDRSGWPAFALYRPVFEVALARGLRVLPGSPPGSWTRAVLGGGLGALPGPARALLGPLPEPPPAVRAAIAEEIRRVHCGHAPEAHLPGMVAAQWLRDAALAASVVRAAGGAPSPGVVLIAGAGHVRRDRGVPLHLRRVGFRGGVGSLAFVGVADDAAGDEALRRAFDGTPPFDFVWLTRPLSSRDPCEQFREQLERLGPAPSGGPAGRG